MILACSTTTSPTLRACGSSLARPILNHFGVTDQQRRILRQLDEHAQLVQRNHVAADQRRVVVSRAPKGDQLVPLRLLNLVVVIFNHCTGSMAQLTAIWSTPEAAP